MDVHSLRLYSQEALDKLVGSIAFFKQLKQSSFEQYELLMQHSRMIEYHIGEVVIEAGQMDTWLHFLLKGQLAVYAGQTPKAIKRVNLISPGEVFGDLAVLMNHKRTATVIVGVRCRTALVFSTDFAVFGELENFGQVNLTTKLIYYRNLVHSLRWKLELYRTRYPQHSFSASHHKVKLYLGPRNSVDELQSLDFQARQLAGFLVDWNLEFTRHGTGAAVNLDQQSLSDLG